MPWVPDELKKVAEELSEGHAPGPYTTRDLLRWFGAERRGHVIVQMIRRALTELSLRTDPDFYSAYIDARLEFRVADGESTDDVPEVEEPTVDALVSTAVGDPTYRIGKLVSANTRPTCVNPNATIEEAVTQMLLHDFSQIPVMQGERSLKGAVSWQSIGSTLALGRTCATVQDCLEEAPVISSDTSLFAAIPRIVEHSYVLVRDKQHSIVGIVTTTDLSLQFRQLAEPFLLLGEIENHLRRLSDGKFSAAEIASVRDPNDPNRNVVDLSDLTFGEHVRLLEKPDRWVATGLRIDRTTFVNQLDRVRRIRNNVMHFDPDGTAPEDLTELRNFVRLLGALGAG